MAQLEIRSQQAEASLTEAKKKRAGAEVALTDAEVQLTAEKKRRLDAENALCDLQKTHEETVKVCFYSAKLQSVVARLDDYA